MANSRSAPQPATWWPCWRTWTRPQPAASPSSLPADCRRSELTGCRAPDPKDVRGSALGCNAHSTWPRTHWIPCGFSARRTASPPGPRLYAPERLLDADFPHERPKARVLAQGVEVGCRHVGHEPFRALLVGRLQPAQRLLVVPQPHVDQCDGAGRVAGRAALERREDLLRLGTLAGAPGYVPQEPRDSGCVASERRHLSSRRQRLGVPPLRGER